MSSIVKRCFAATSNSVFWVRGLAVFASYGVATSLAIAACGADGGSTSCRSIGCDRGYFCEERTGECRKPKGGECDVAVGCDGATCVQVSGDVALCVQPGDRYSACSETADCRFDECISGTCTAWPGLVFDLETCVAHQLPSPPEGGAFRGCWFDVDSGTVRVAAVADAGGNIFGLWPDGGLPPGWLGTAVYSASPGTWVDLADDSGALVLYGLLDTEGVSCQGVRGRVGLAKRDVTVESIGDSMATTVGSAAVTVELEDVELECPDGSLLPPFSGIMDVEGGDGGSSVTACETTNGHICTELVEGDASAFAAQCAQDGVARDACPSGYILGCENAAADSAGAPVTVNVYWYPDACGLEIGPGQACINGTQVGNGCQ